MLNSVEAFWCCLAPPERGSFDLVLVSITPDAPYVLKATFDAYWAAFDAVGSTLRHDAFIGLYGLTPGTIVIEEGLEFEVYFVDLSTWTQITAFLLTPAAACVKKCFIGDPGFPL